MKRPVLLILVIGIAVNLWGAGDAAELTIQQAVRLALKNNKEFRAGREEVNLYRYRLRQALGFLPTVTLEGSKNIDEKLMEIEMPPAFPGAPPQSVTIDFTKNYEFTFQVMQPLFTGGRIFYSQKNARLDLAIAREKQQDARASLILRVKKVFFNILVLKELLKAHREAAQLARDNLTNVKENFHLGMVSKYDLLRGELAVASVTPDLLKVEKLLALAHLDLKFITGIPQDRPLRVTGTLDHGRRALDRANLLQKALLNHSELRQTALQLKKAAHLLRIAYGRFLPDIFLTAAYSFRSDAFRFGSGAWESYYTINLGIRFPIFDQLKRSGRIGEIKTSKKILDLNYRRLQDAVRLQVRDRVLTMEQEYKNIQAGLKNVETASEGVRIARLTYDEGLTTILELNASFNDLTRARVDYFQAVYNYNIAAAELEKLTKGVSQ